MFFTVTRYLYDGFNRIAEYTGTTLAKVYLWGLDLSGTPQGAGGVGGLLSILDNASTIRYYPTYDGNGNVSEYINSTAGTQSAHFEYDPFGNLTVDSSTNAASFPYRFSTKPQDPVTGLYYYGYRYYDPVTGRWPSRDPIEEEGGINLYGFVGNDGVGKWDYLGLSTTVAGQPGYQPDGVLGFTFRLKHTFTADEIKHTRVHYVRIQISGREEGQEWIAIPNTYKFDVAEVGRNNIGDTIEAQAGAWGVYFDLNKLCEAKAIFVGEQRPLKDEKHKDLFYDENGKPKNNVRHDSVTLYFADMQLLENPTNTWRIDYYYKKGTKTTKVVDTAKLK